MNRFTSNRRVLTAALLAMTAGTAAAQCNPTWNPPPSIGYPEGLNGNVLCSCIWDPDGNGPLSPCLVVGGDFTVANLPGYNHIVMWDGSGWKPLHIGVNGTVRALTVDTSTNTLIAGGSFTQAGIVAASKIARFSYSTGLWSAIGSGITSAGDVNALAYEPLHNWIILGGSFTSAGGTASGALAKISGSTYSGISAFFGGTINALYVNSEAKLYVGGIFTDPTLGNAANLIMYDTLANTWSGLYGGLPGAGVNAITGYSPDALNNRIVAAGQFGSVAGRQLNSIAYLGGNGWYPLGTGLVGSVQGLTTRNLGRELYAVGAFTLNGTGQIVNNVAEWTDPSGAWSALGGGLNDVAYTAATYKDAIYVGGPFTQVNNTDASTTATRIAAWSGSRWGALKSAPSGPVNCMINTGSALLIGGDFDMYDPVNNTFAHNLVGFDGSQFSASVNTHGFNGTDGPITSILIKSNGLTAPTTVVAGSFSHAGGQPAANIAAAQFAGEFAQVGSGTDGAIYGLATYGCSGGPLQTCGTVAVGNFSHSGTTACNNIVRWGPGPVSLNLGTGLDAPGRCLLPFNGKLLVGGDFTMANGTLTGHLAQWDGTNFTTFNGSFVNGTVYAMTVYNGNLVIGGNFDQINGSPVLMCAMWNGSSWIDMSTGIGTSFGGSVFALAVFNNELYAGGLFYTAAPSDPQFIARWNGSSWVSVAGDMSGFVNCMNTLNDNLVAGGMFMRAGSSYTPYLAQLACSCWANCDNSTTPPILNINDFQCFLNNYAAGTQYANCDNSTVAPVLNVNDFQCFVNKYAAGCN
jgi:hypothetical protein